MTVDEAVANLKQLEGADSELAHITADRILLEFLATNGYTTVTDAWNDLRRKVGFWYA